MFVPNAQSGSRWAPEHYGWNFGLSRGNFYSNTVVNPTAVEGLRKVKNFQMSVHFLPEDYTREHVCIWVLYVQKELQPGELVDAPCMPVAASMVDVLDRPRDIIDAGVVGNRQVGNPNFCPLARLLDSGDSLAFLVMNCSSDSDVLGVYVSLSFSICYA
jgi:hypothetical protein